MAPRHTTTIGDLLKGLRLDAGLTQAQLADKAGLSARGVGDIERGLKPRPHRYTIALLADALQLTPPQRALLEAVASGRPPSSNKAVSDRAPTADDALATTSEEDDHQTSARHNLPSAISTFVDREIASAEVKRLLQTTRLLTLTGAGGCGKSRLALHVGSDLVGDFQDGVWLVELAPFTHADLIPQAVANVLGVREVSAQPLPESIVRHAQSRRILLILDNCEHLVDGCARFAEMILTRCPRVQILATSREGLRVSGEVVYRVPSLDVPGTGTPLTLEELGEHGATRLFVERASAAVSRFSVDHASVTAIVRICERLDGIPLAIELAAARAATLTVEQLAERLTDRFQLLTRGSRTALPRQQTLRASLDWSYDLLDDEQVLFRRLSVFAGGFDLEAAEAVCADHREPTSSDTASTFDGLVGLVEKSLLVAQQEVSGDTRYHFLDTVRQYAQEKLAASGESDVIRLRHAMAYLAMAERAERELRGPRQIAWLDRLDREHNNVRAALDWFGGHERWDLALRLASALGEYWHVRGHYLEGRARLEEALDHLAAPVDAALRARAYRALSVLTLRQGDLVAARRFLDTFLQAAEESGDASLLVEAKGLGGTLLRDFPTAERARTLLDAALALARARDLYAETGPILIDLGIVLAWLGDHAGSEAHFAEGLAVLRGTGDGVRLAFGLNLACMIANVRGAYRQARALAEEYAPLARALGDQSGQANSRRHLAEALAGEGDLAGAEAPLTEALIIYRRLDDRYGIALSVTELGRLHVLRGDRERARVLTEEGLALARAMDAQILVRALRAAGDVALATCETEKALAHYREGIALMASHWYGVMRPVLLEGLAGVAATRNQPERVLRLAGAAAAEWARLGATASPLRQAWFEGVAESARQAVGEEVSDAAFAEGKAMTSAQALRYALEEGD
jgi:non-specific serine/threonine protein kinase